jgi:hypothetical protein
MQKVTLNVTLKDGSLDVDQTDNPNPISPGHAEITGQLHLSDGHDGSFNTLKDKDPGFAWIDLPKPGVFGQADVQVRDKKIVLSDTHTGTNSAGEWIYQLWATIDGKPYSTIYVPEP